MHGQQNIKSLTLSAIRFWQRCGW